MELHIANATIHILGAPGLAAKFLQIPEGVAGLAHAHAPAAVHVGAANTVAPLSALPQLGEPWPGMDGYYVGILPALGDCPAMHLVASRQEGERLAWGEYGNDAPATSRHDGRANTAALIASGKAYPAAQWCAALGQDWHLPSQAELFMALLYAPQVFKKDGWYWSSTQHSRDGAFAQDFEDGYSGWDGKILELRARAFRWIHALQPLTT